MAFDAHVAALARTEPSAFVAERKRRVAELKAVGDREAAIRLDALRKLTITDWALNVAAAETDTAAVVEAFWAAATAMAQVQLAAAEGTSSGAEVRSATRSLRSATAALADAAAGIAAAHGYRGAGSSSVEIAARLVELAPDQHRLAALRAGTVGLPTPPADDVAVASTSSAGASNPRRRGAARGHRSTTADSTAMDAVGGVESDAAPAAISEREQLAATRAQRELLGAARRQQRQVRQAERAVDDASLGVQAAAERLAEAEARLATAEATRDEARRRADELAAAVADSGSA